MDQQYDFLREIREGDMIRWDGGVTPQNIPVKAIDIDYNWNRGTICATTPVDIQMSDNQWILAIAHELWPVK